MIGSRLSAAAIDSVQFGTLVASITEETANAVRQDVNSDCFPTRALEQGKIDRRQAAAATKVRLVNPH
jgi:hypothetical protein